MAAVRHLLLLLLLLPLLLLLLLQPPSSNCKLLHVSLVFRHGHRSPIHLLPVENRTVANTWPQGLGQLSNVGKRNAWELGEFLRNRYSSLLGDGYNATQQEILSSDVDRTLMSAQVCCAALFRPTGQQVWSQALAWQPVPVHTRPGSADQLLQPGRSCSRRRQQLEAAARRSPQYRRFRRRHAAFHAAMAAKLGLPGQPFRLAYRLYDTLMVEATAGMSLPVTPEELRRLRQLAEYQWRVFAWDVRLIRIGIGRLLRRVLRSLVAAAAAGGNGEARRRMSLYSGHDTTLVPLLAALGVRDGVWPNYSACVMLELHTGAGGGQWVRVFYRNGTRQPPLRLVPGGCPNSGHGCPLATFADSVGRFSVTRAEFEAECRPAATASWRHGNQRK